MYPSVARSRLMERSIPADVDRRRLTEYEPARRRRLGQAQAGQPLERAPDRGQRLHARKVHADTDVRALCERELNADVRTPDVEAVRLGEHRRVAVRSGQRDGHELALADRRTRELDVASGVAVYHRRGGLEPERLLDRARQEARIGKDERELVGV